MTAYRAKRTGTAMRLFGAVVLLMGVAGCTDVDNMLFGESSDQAQTATADNSAPQTPAATAPAPVAEPAGNSSTGLLATITPVPIEPGSDTGTDVSKTIASLRSQVIGLQDHLTQNASRLADLRNTAATAALSYHEAKAHITTRLQLGTTRGNPELVSEWNTAQAALDQLSSNINALNALATAISGDSSTAQYALDQITATFNVSGAVDEDHRQLAVLQDETNQTIILIDRLLKEVSDDIQRQTAYVANERGNLTVLANAIKNGELYDTSLTSPLASAAPRNAVAYAGGESGSPVVVIRFDRSHVDYQQLLYSALSQTLQTKPSANFEVVAVSPTRGTASAVQLAQTAAERHAQDVMRSMTDMGVPASRLSVASTTDPSAKVSEVRVFAR